MVFDKTRISNSLFDIFFPLLIVYGRSHHKITDLNIFLVFLNLYIAEQYSFLYRRTARSGTLIFYTERFIREPLFRKRDIEEHKMIGFICRSKSRSSDLRLIKRSFIVYSEGGVMSGHCTMSNRKTSLFSVCFSFLFSYPLFDFLLMDYRALVSNHDCDFQEARRYSLSFPISVFQKKSTSSLFTFRSFSHIER